MAGRFKRHIVPLLTSTIVCVAGTAGVFSYTTGRLTFGSAAEEPLGVQKLRADQNAELTGDEAAVGGDETGDGAAPPTLLAAERALIESRQAVLQDTQPAAESSDNFDEAGRYAIPLPPVTRGQSPTEADYDNAGDAGTSAAQRAFSNDDVSQRARDAFADTTSSQTANRYGQTAGGLGENLSDAPLPTSRYGGQAPAGAVASDAPAGAGYRPNPFATSPPVSTPSANPGTQMVQPQSLAGGGGLQPPPGYSNSLQPPDELPPPDQASQLEPAQLPGAPEANPFANGAASGQFGGRAGAAPQAGAQYNNPDAATNAAREAFQQPSAAPQRNLSAPSDLSRRYGSTAPSQTPSQPQSGGQQPSFGSSQATGTGRPGEQALEGPQQPSLSIQKQAPQEIQVGKPCKFRVVIRNTGPKPAADVIVTDEIPEGTQLLGTSPQAQQSGGKVAWNLGTLSPGEERDVEMELMPTAEGEIGSVAMVTFSAQASVKTLSTLPQLALRLTAAQQVMIGEQQIVKVELLNPGSGDATGVMLFENVPQNLSHEAGPSLEFEVGTLRAGESRELELVLTAEKAGHVVNLVTAQAEGNLQVQQEVEFEVIAPGLQVDFEGPSKRYLERQATYQVIVQNPGTASAQDIELVTHLPKGMRFLQANNLGEYDSATHSVYWSLAELPEGERGVVELVTMPIEAGEQTFQIEGKARQGLADQTLRPVVVEGLAAIMFEVVDVDDPIEIGGETTYEIRVGNQGTKAATNVRVTVSLPPELNFLGASGQTRHSMQNGLVIFEPLQQLAPKADANFQVRVQGIRAGDQRVTVKVDTDDTEQPISREESTRVFGDE